MNKFNNYKLTKNDKHIIKKFKLDREFRILSKDELDTYWRKILNLSDTNKETKLKNFYRPLLDMKGYISIINDNEYFFFDYNEKNFYNIFFYNMNNLKEGNIKSLTNSKDSIEIFKVICSILREERKLERSLSYKIMLPNKYTKLFFKLIDKSVREIWKNTRMNIKKIKNNYHYYYRGNYNEIYRGIRFLRTYVFHYKKSFIDIDEYIKKLNS